MEAVVSWRWRAEPGRRPTVKAAVVATHAAATARVAWIFMVAGGTSRLGGCWELDRMRSKTCVVSASVVALSSAVGPADFRFLVGGCATKRHHAQPDSQPRSLASTYS